MSPKPKRNATTIDEYLAALSADKRAALQKLRKTIRAAAPKAEECISYQVPAFRLDGKFLVAFGAAANHCAFYLMSSSTVETHKAELKGHDTSKGTIRFQADKPLPVALVRKLVKARIAENAGQRGKSEQCDTVMRIVVVSDIHGNRTAFEAVLADLRHTSPDLVLHGGDLADGGSNPAEIVDRVRALGWQGVVGNADEMLVMPETLEEFAKHQSPQLQPLFALVREMAAATRDALGEQRLTWLRALPRVQIHGSLALVHASPDSVWHSPTAEAGDAELESVYAPLGRRIVVYGHIHRSFIRRVSGMIVANTGSVSLSYDGDPRAAYLLLDDFQPEIRRVEYDVKKELKALADSGLPHADWVAKILEKGRFQMP